jgi:hypothetical protein
MQFNLYQWLFDDAIAPFHYFWPYLIACGVGLLIWFYYWVEGRKRFIKSRHALKYMLDRYLNWLAIICFVGVMIDLSRWALEGYFFAWRFWRYLWLVSLLVWAVFFVIHRVRRYPLDLAYFKKQERDSIYLPKSKKKRQGKQNKVKLAAR